MLHYCILLILVHMFHIMSDIMTLYRKEGGSFYRNCELSIRSDEGLTLKTSAFRISVRWPIYIINSVDKTKIFVYCIGKSHKVQYDVQYE